MKVLLNKTTGRVVRVGEKVQTFRGEEDAPELRTFYILTQGEEPGEGVQAERIQAPDLVSAQRYARTKAGEGARIAWAGLEGDMWQVFGAIDGVMTHYDEDEGNACDICGEPADYALYNSADRDGGPASHLCAEHFEEMEAKHNGNFDRLDEAHSWTCTTCGGGNGETAHCCAHCSAPRA